MVALWRERRAGRCEAPRSRAEAAYITITRG
jgi:hypothetical protein